MYPINLGELLNKSECIKKPILFFSCISFEARSETAAKKVFNALDEEDVIWKFFLLIDNGSSYEKDCCIKQNEVKASIMDLLNIGEDHFKEYDLFESTPWEYIISYYTDIIDKHPEIKTIVLDLTTIPKRCYFRFLKWLLDEGLGERDFIICYTKPQEYGSNEMESNPTNPETLIGNFKKYDEILWIPLLGFKSEFTRKIMENIREMNLNSEMKIIPMIGFPSYRPDYFDKCLVSHAKIESAEIMGAELTEALKKPILAVADDPFDTYRRIMNTIENYEDKEIILSPLGPKPMALGMALAAIKANLPVYSIQARSYHPKYSIGEGESSAYWIKRDGEYTYE